MRTLYFCVASFFISCFFVSGSAPVAFAQSKQVALAVAVRGEVFATLHDTAKRKISLKSPLYEKDIIKTGKRGKIQIMFSDSTLISLGKNTEMKISDYVWNANQKSGALKTHVKEGTFRVMGGAIANFSPEEFKTETPSAVIGIRGSMYAGNVSGFSLSVLFQGGKGIDIMNSLGTVAITKPGYGTRVSSPTEPPLKPIKFTPDDLLKINEAFAGDAPPPNEPPPPEESDQQPLEKKTITNEENPPPEKTPQEDKNSPREENGNADDSQKPPMDGKEPASQENQPPKEESPILHTDNQSNPDSETTGDGPSPVHMKTDDATGEPRRDPLMGETFIDPTTGEPIQDPMMGGNFIDPTTGEPVQDPMMGGTFIDPTTGEPIQDPMMGGTFIDPTTGEPIQDPMRGDTFIDPMTGEPMKDPMMGDTFIDPMTGEPMKDPIMGDTFIDPMTGEPMRDPIIGDTFIDPTTGEPMKDPMRGDTFIDPMTGEPMKDPMMGDSFIDPMTGEPMRDPIMGDTFIDPMTGEPMKDPMRGDTFIDPMTGEPMKDPMMGGTFIDPMTGEFMNDPMMGDTMMGDTMNTPHPSDTFLDPFPQDTFKDPLATDPFIDPTTYYDPATDPNNQTDTGGDPNATPTLMPTDGVDGYFGSFLKTDGTQSETIRVFMEVNWKVGTGFGIVEPATEFTTPAFFFGDVNGTSLDNIQLFGTDGPIAIEGSGSGVFKGIDHQFFDMSLNGLGFDLTVPGTPSGQGWNIGVTTGITPKDAADVTAPSGISTWKGYTVAISENTNNLLQRKSYMNDTNSDFTLTINRNTGTVSGSLNAPQVNPASNTNAGINLASFGGTGKSAYILDDHFGALIDSGVVEDDNPGATNNSINTHGNYITTDDPQKQFSEYAMWGYWEISHSEAGGTEMYHAHIPYSMWIAGENTPTTYIQSLITDTSFVGKYAGPARGMKIDTNGVSHLTGGRVELAIDFSNGSIAPWVTNPSSVSSRLSFNEVVLDIGFNPSSPDFNTVNGFGFNGIITQSTKPGGNVDTSIISSHLNGAYYGPKANSIGGNFHAEFSSEEYLGVFGGNLVNGPAP